MRFTHLLLAAACCFVAFAAQLEAQSRLNFDGYGDHVLLNGTDFQPPWTVECWVSKNEVAPYQHLLTSTDGTSGIRIEQYINTSRVGITKKGVADWQFNYTMPTGVWTHLAVTNTGTQMRLYINGQSVGTINGSIDAPLGMIGLNTTGAGALNAKIDELRYWKTVVSQANLQAWTEKSLDATHPDFANLAHYYKFDEGGGTVANDDKGALPGTVLGAQFCPVFSKDLSAAAVVSPAGFVNQFTQNEVVTIRVSNPGTQAVAEDFTVRYSLDGGPAVSQTVPASSNPLPPFGSRDVSFPAVDLSGSGIHTVLATVDLPGDLSADNDTVFATSSLSQISLGNVTGFEQDPDIRGEFTVAAGVSRVKVIFYVPKPSASGWPRTAFLPTRWAMTSCSPTSSLWILARNGRTRAVFTKYRRSAWKCGFSNRPCALPCTAATTTD